MMRRAEAIKHADQFMTDYPDPIVTTETVVEEFLRARSEYTPCECGQEEKGEHTDLGSAHAALLLGEFLDD